MKVIYRKCTLMKLKKYMTCWWHKKLWRTLWWVWQDWFWKDSNDYNFMLIKSIILSIFVFIFYLQNFWKYVFSFKNRCKSFSFRQSLGRRPRVTLLFFIYIFFNLEGWGRRGIMCKWLIFPISFSLSKGVGVSLCAHRYTKYCYRYIIDFK